MHDDDSGSAQQGGWQPPEYVSPWIPASGPAMRAAGRQRHDLLPGRARLRRRSGTGHGPQYPAGPGYGPGYGPAGYGAATPAALRPYGRRPGYGGGPVILATGGPGYGGAGYGGPGGPGYGPPGYGQNPWGGYGAPPPPPPRSGFGRALAYLAVAVLAAGAGAGAAVALNHNSAPPPRSPRPATPAPATAVGSRRPAAPATAAAPDQPVRRQRLRRLGRRGNGGTGGTNSGTGSLNASALAAKVDPGIVDITSELKYSDATAEGTGMVISSSGLVLTNNHVIDEATSVSAHPRDLRQDLHRARSSATTRPTTWRCCSWSARPA